LAKAGNNEIAAKNSTDRSKVASLQIRGVQFGKEVDFYLTLGNFFINILLDSVYNILH